MRDISNRNIFKRCTVSHTESKNMCIASVCSDLTDLSPQRCAIFYANCSNRVLMVLNYLNCLRESMCHCHYFTAAAPTADGVDEQVKSLTKRLVVCTCPFHFT